MAEIRLEEITEEGAKEKKMIGISAGIDIAHCLYLGSRYSSEKDFLRAVKYYRHCNKDEFPIGAQCAVVIAFYKDRGD